MYSFSLNAQTKELFHILPKYSLVLARQHPVLDDDLRHSQARKLGISLGATLYSPAIRPRLADDVIRCAASGVRSMVLCLEDSIADTDVERAEENLQIQMTELDRHSLLYGQENIPLLFIRPRNPQQLIQIAENVSVNATRIAGFVLPKFDTVTGPGWLDALEQANTYVPYDIYGMPILETREIAYAESRLAALTTLQQLLRKHHRYIPCIRLGGTDLSGIFGLRRQRDLSIYDVNVVRDIISDIINIFGRTSSDSGNDDSFVISGAVWEFYGRHDSDRAGLVREIALDKANGLLGKTVIHPSHVAIVHALLAVTQEEYEDAVMISSSGAGGAMASTYANKMNEAKPHCLWAQRVLERADTFGVLNQGISYSHVLGNTEIGGIHFESRS